MKRVGTKEEYDIWGTVRLAWLEFILRRDGVINTESFPISEFQLCHFGNGE